MDHAIIQELKQAFPFIEKRPSSDWPAINVPQDKLLEIAQALRDQFDFDMLMDATAIDWADKSPRFTVVYHLLCRRRDIYLRIASDCANDEEPQSPSLAHLWPAADWHERETYDMFGVIYKGHPDLKRILMWDDYPHFPLRKEFPLAGIETELPAADVAEATGAKVKPAPMMGGPFKSVPQGSMSKSEPVGFDESWTEKNPKPKRK